MAGFMRLEVWRERMTLRWDRDAREARFVPTSEAHGYDDLPAEVAREVDGYAEPNIGGEGSMAYFARYSAPGYMDCTPTTVPWPSAAEAINDAFVTYGGGDAEEAADLAIRFGMPQDQARAWFLS